MAKVKYNKDGSANLTDHAKTHHRNLYDQFNESKNEGVESKVSSSRQGHLKPEKIRRFDACETTRLLVEWIIMDAQSFISVEKKFFIRLVESLNPSYQLPKKDAVRDYIIARYNQCKINIKNELKAQKGLFSLTTDIWTSPSFIPFLCVTVHFIDSNWRLKSFLLAFRHIFGHHAGLRIYDCFKEILTEYDLMNRVLTVTLDNASNNDTFMDEMILNKVVIDNECQIRCFAHILNLAAQDSIQEFIDKIEPLRSAIKAIKYSPSKIEKLHLYCDQEIPQIPHVKPFLDVRTRWNSTYDMIERVLILRAPLTRLFNEIRLQDPNFPEFDVNYLNCFELLVNFLRPFKEVTEMCSGQNYATFSTVVPLYQFLLSHLADTILKFSSFAKQKQDKRPGHLSLPPINLCQDIQAAVSIAHEKLNSYYDIKSDLATCATVLDPRLNIGFYEKSNQKKAQNEK